MQIGLPVVNPISFIRTNVGVGQFPSGSSTTFSPTTAATAGHKVILFVASYAGGNASYQAVSSVTDSAGNTWTVDNAAGAPDGRTVASICSSNLTSGLSTSAVITVNFNGSLGSGSTVGLTMNEWLFPSTTSGVDKTGGAATSFAKANSAQISAVTNGATDLIYACTAFGSSPGTVVGPTGYTSLASNIYYLLPTTKQRFSSSLSWANNSNAAQSMVAYAS